MQVPGTRAAGHGRIRRPQVRRRREEGRRCLALRRSGCLQPYHSTGSSVRPPVKVPERTRSCSTGTASRIVGKRASSWEKTA